LTQGIFLQLSVYI